MKKKYIIISIVSIILVFACIVLSVNYNFKKDNKNDIKSSELKRDKEKIKKEEMDNEEKQEEDLIETKKEDENNTVVETKKEEVKQTIPKQYNNSNYNQQTSSNNQKTNENNSNNNSGNTNNQTSNDNNTTNNSNSNNNTNSNNENSNANNNSNNNQNTQPSQPVQNEKSDMEQAIELQLGIGDPVTYYNGHPISIEECHSIGGDLKSRRETTLVNRYECVYTTYGSATAVGLIVQFTIDGQVYRKSYDEYKNILNG